MARNLLSRRTSGKKREFYCGLPRLPSEAEKSRVPKVNFTPKAKRIRYEMCSTEDKRNDSAYYYGNYPVLLEEENIILIMTQITKLNNPQPSIPNYLRDTWIDKHNKTSHKPIQLPTHWNPSECSPNLKIQDGLQTF
ncbi:hypothetical protein RhiirB3_443677 [Rhizophagus irregularis]|nr:hypothetical protein RhiirB3_443677 [Rhizophagus irregularis]